MAISAVASQIAPLLSVNDVRLALVFAVVVLLVRLYLMYSQNNEKLPPGPYGLPILGYLPFLRKDIHLKLTNLSKKYGGFFSIRLGNKTVVILGRHDLIREAFRREEFSGRPSSGFTQILDGYGIINSEGKLWKDQRKFLHLRLRELGVSYAGKIESKILSEIECFLGSVAQLASKPCDLSVPISTCISNVISALIMSVRFREDNKQLRRFLYLIDEGFRLFSVASIVNYVPAFKYLPFVNKAYNQLMKNKAEMAGFIEEIVLMHKKSFDPNSIRDLMDAYINEINTAKSNGTENEVFSGKDPEKQLCQIMGDLFTAGQETVKTTLLWAILFILKHPDVQSEVQKELDTVVGRSRLPTLEDLPYLPFTEATILEVMRRCTVVGLGTMHATTKPVSLGEFRLPSDTYVVPLLWAVHMDNSIWDQPEKFEPRRFLSKDGKIVKPKWFMPFGVGRRMCLGDTLARMEIFLFFSSLLHVFRVSASEDAPLPNTDAQFGATIKPQPFQVKCIPRDVQRISQIENLHGTSGCSMEILL